MTQNPSDLSGTIIHQRKVEVISWGADTRLSYKFAKLHLANYDINGANVFVGICTAEARAAASGKLNGRSSILTINSEREWKTLWTRLGAPPPGRLPKGTCAMFFFTGASHDGHNGVNVGWIERSFGPFGSTVSVRFDTHLERNETGEPPRESFAAAVIPKTFGGVGYSLSRGVTQSSMISAYLATLPPSQTRRFQPSGDTGRLRTSPTIH